LALGWPNLGETFGDRNFGFPAGEVAKEFNPALSRPTGFNRPGPKNPGPVKEELGKAPLYPGPVFPVARRPWTLILTEIMGPKRLPGKGPMRIPKYSVLIKKHGG